MTASAKSGIGLVLAVHPTARGIGWALFEGPLAPLDWSIVRSNRNATCLSRLERIIDRYEPSVIVLEQFENLAHRRVDRMRRLCRGISALAGIHGIEALVYSKAAIRSCFASAGAVTRHEIAQTIAAHIDAFRLRLPPRRKPWQNLDSRQSLFDAVAVALTHFAITGG